MCPKVLFCQGWDATHLITEGSLWLPSMAVTCSPAQTQQQPTKSVLCASGTGVIVYPGIVLMTHSWCQIFFISLYFMVHGGQVVQCRTCDSEVVCSNQGGSKNQNPLKIYEIQCLLKAYSFCNLLKLVMSATDIIRSLLTCLCQRTWTIEIKVPSSLNCSI